jgi:putative transposase
MRERELIVRPRRRYVRTTDGDHDGPFYPNLLHDGFTPDGPDQLWVTDTICIRVRHGFVYLAAMLDAWSRKVIGYALSRHIDTRLCLAALDAALQIRRPPSGCIEHSDRGTQYSSADYRAAVRTCGLRGSMSRRGNPYDNAQAESLMKTLKCEEVYPNDYQTFADVIEALPRFLDDIYNAKRLYSALGYLSPMAFQDQQTRKAA